jgi:hypothetical protein
MIPPPLPLDRSPPSLPPTPLPGGLVGSVYATRNDAFSVETGWRLEDGGLRIEPEDKPAEVVPWSKLTSMRLEFSPSRAEPNRYRCSLRDAKHGRWTFCNRRYRGLLSFEDTSADYVRFVRELLLVVQMRSPDCHVVAGATKGNYIVGCLGFFIAAVAVLAVMLFSLSVGLWWLAIIKGVLIFIYLPLAWRWLRRNRARSIEAGVGSALEDVLPRVE